MVNTLRRTNLWKTMQVSTVYLLFSFRGNQTHNIPVFIRSAHHKSLNKVTVHGQHVSSHKSLENDTCLNRILVFLLPRRSTKYIPVFASTIHHRSLNKVPAHGHMLDYGTNCVKCLIRRQVMAINRSGLQMAASVKVKPQRL